MSHESKEENTAKHLIAVQFELKQITSAVLPYSFKELIKYHWMSIVSATISSINLFIGKLKFQVCTISNKHLPFSLSLCKNRIQPWRKLHQ